MNYLLLIISILIPTILGFGALFLIQKLSRREHGIKSTILNLIISFGIGSGILTFLMFWWGFVGLPLQYFSIFSIVLVGGLFLFCNFKFPLSKFLQSRLENRKFTKFTLPRLTILEIILILIIIFEVCFVLITGSLRPIIGFDAIATWAWKAKVLFYQQSEFFNSNSILFMGGDGHIGYPLHIPLLMAWVYFWFGQINDVLIGIVFALYFLSLIGFVYFSLRTQNITKKIAMIFTAILSTIPLLTYHGFHAYVDLPLTFYFTIASIFLFKYINADSSMSAVSPRSQGSDNFEAKLTNTARPRSLMCSKYLILFGIFAGLTTWTKNEGLMLAGVLIIVFVFYLLRNFDLKKKNDFKKFILPFALFALPWIIFKTYFGLDYANIGSVGIDFDKFHPEIFGSALGQIFISHSFHIWPGFFILILILNWRRIFARPYVYLTLIIFGVIAAYSILYIFTSSYQFVLDGTIISRNFMTIIPLTIFLSGILFGHKKI